MNTVPNPKEPEDKEIETIQVVYGALRQLDREGQRRVLDYIERKLGQKSATTDQVRYIPSASEDRGDELAEATGVSRTTEVDGEEGINPVAQRWMRRNNLSANQLSAIFSIGGDNIDLISVRVPGDNKKERMRSVLLLKGIASYLASGAARTAHADAKEACEHYDAWDSNHLAENLKSFASEIGGSKESGYSLNARGLVSATDLIREMIQSVGTS